MSAWQVGGSDSRCWWPSAAKISYADLTPVLSSLRGLGVAAVDGHDVVGLRFVPEGFEVAGGAVVEVGEEVAVDVVGDLDRRVADLGLYDFWVGAAGDPERHSGVAEVVGAQGCEPKRFGGGMEVASAELVGAWHVALDGGEHEIVGADVVRLDVLVERFGGLAGERYLAAAGLRLERAEHGRAVVQGQVLDDVNRPAR